MSKKMEKKTIDVPQELYEKIMNYAHGRKIYKFTPTVIELIELGLEALEKKDEGIHSAVGGTLHGGN